jgi:hypothetical protein
VTEDGRAGAGFGNGLSRLDGRLRGWGVAPVSDAIRQFPLQGGNPNGLHLRRAIFF